jgi:hypothetical protein
MTFDMFGRRIVALLIVVLIAGATHALAVSRTVYGVPTAPGPPMGVGPVVPTTGGPPSRRPIAVPPLVRGLPPGYISILPAGYRVVVIRGVRYYFVGGVHYRPIFYQGRTYYVRVNL